MKLFGAINCYNSIYGLKQIHSTKIINITDKIENSNSTHFDKTGDGLLTNLEDITLSIKTADCCPIFLYEKEKEVIGILHSGRKGTLGRILSKCCEIISSKYGGNTRNILLKLGPHICNKCYEISKEIADEFDYNGVVEKANKYFLNLQEILTKEANQLGIKSIEYDNRCSFESDSLFSYRGHDKVDRNLSFIIKRSINDKDTLG